MPEPGLSSFALPPEDGLVRDARLEVPATLPADTDLSPDTIVQRAAAMVAATDPSEWSLGSLAERLQYSPEAAFALVRDSIGYDPYPGVLRGGLGTLLARAGNDVDRALLLQALLDRMVIRTRLVEGTLDDATVTALLHRAFQPPATPLGPPPIDPAELVDLPSLSTRAHRDYSLLRGAIGDRDASMTGAADTAATAESRQHVWLQMQFGTSWLDLDPSMPDAQPGQALTAVTKVLEAVPDAWRDTVTVRVIAERLSDGVLSDDTVLDQQLDAATVARQDVFLAMTPVGDFDRREHQPGPWHPAQVGDRSCTSATIPSRAIPSPWSPRRTSSMGPRAARRSAPSGWRSPWQPRMRRRRWSRVRCWTA